MSVPGPQATRLAARALAVEPFQVMRLLARARELEAAGRQIFHLEIGEPDFPTPAPVMAAAERALAAGHTHYTPAAGLPRLRETILAARTAIKAEPWNAAGWNKNILTIEQLIRDIEADKNPAPVLSIEEFTGKKSQP